MKMLHAAGAEYLVITPGNYGETFSRQMKDIDLTYEMKCSNYVGETIDMAEAMGIRGILFIAHIGKFIKVSGGIMNTHSRNADARAELMAAAALRSGAGAEDARRILETNTTEESLDILAECGEAVSYTHLSRSGIQREAVNRGSDGTDAAGFLSFRGQCPGAPSGQQAASAGE